MPRIYKCISAVIIILFSLSQKSALATIIKANGESVFLSNITLGCNHALNQARQKAQILAGSSKILSFQSKYCSSNEQDADCVLDKYSSLSFDSQIIKSSLLSLRSTPSSVTNGVPS